MLEEYLLMIERRLLEVEQRVDHMVRHGPVTDVDAEKHLVRMRIGGTDEEPQKSPWIPYGQVAGAMKVHSPPSVGQNMTLFAPTGDPRQALALPFTWNNDNQSPSKSKDEHVLTFGKVKVTIKSDSLSIAVDQSEVEIKNGEINVKSEKVITVGNTYLGQDDKGQTQGSKIETQGNVPAKKAFAKV